MAVFLVLCGHCTLSVHTADYIAPVPANANNTSNMLIGLIVSWPQREVFEEGVDLG